jgi:hypothetical protein
MFIVRTTIVGKKDTSNRKQQIEQNMEAGKYEASA